MDRDKARNFWQIVVDGGATLCELLDAATDINPLLTVEVEQVPAGDSAVPRIAVSCNHDPSGIQAVQALVAVTPPMPPCIQVFAF